MGVGLVILRQGVRLGTPSPVASRSPPFINYFLDDALEGRRGLRETRLHLVASSPLYFAERMPLAQVHWGMDDTIVPIANGTYFLERYRQRFPSPESCLSVRLHPDAGQD